MAKFFLCGRKDYESAQTLAKKNSSRSFQRGEREAEGIARGTVEEEEETSATSRLKRTEKRYAIRNAIRTREEWKGGAKSERKKLKGRFEGRIDRERESKVEGETEKIRSAASSSSSLILRYGPRKPTSSLREQASRKGTGERKIRPILSPGILFRHFLDFSSAATLCSRDSQPLSTAAAHCYPALVAAFARGPVALAVL